MTLNDHLRIHLKALALAGVEYVPVAPSPPDGWGAAPSEEAAPAPDTRRVALDQLALDVSKCSRCPGLFSTRTQTVFGSGPPSAEVCFLGDAPWADDDREGLPFRGEAGGLHDKILTAMGFGRQEVYLTTAIKCRPAGNRPPTADECGNCREYLDKQLELVQPKAICCLGTSAAQALLNTAAPIQTLRGQVHDHRGTPVVCTFHPAYLLKTEAAKKDCWDDMKLLLRTLGRPHPGKS